MEQGEPNGSERDRSLMEIGFVDTLLLLSLFIILTAVSGWLISDILINKNASELNEEIIVYTLCVSSVAGSSIYYARKLYKAGINDDYNFQPDGFSIARISTIAYFLLRIPISLIISLIVYALWRLSISFTIEPKFETAKSNLYLFFLIGFLSGFSAGKLLTYFERDGLNLLKGKPDNEQR